MLKFGNLTLDMPFIQAALSGYSDYAMRILARKFGCPLSLTGVILAKSAANKRVIRKKVFAPGDNEHPVGGQLMGDADIKSITAGAVALESQGHDLIDLNFGCPSPKVLRRHRGGWLLQQPDTVVNIFNAVRDVVKCPIVAKLRFGYGDSQENIDKFWQIVDGLADSGVDGLVIHGRSVMKRYRDKADWQILADVKKKYPKVTIVGSGDLFEAEDILNKMRTSGIDGVAIARGAIGNPWIFTDLKSLIDNGVKADQPTLPQVSEVMKEHLEDICKLYHERKAVGYFRKFAVQYCKRHPERKNVLLAIMDADTKAQVFETIDKWF